MSKPVIMIVDDEDAITSSLSYCLQKEGYEVLVAYNGADAIKMVVNRVPDLIVSDIMMPEVDGFEFCRRIRDYYKTRDIPFIFLTAKTTDRDKVEAVRLGGDDYVTKPFDLQELILKVRRSLEKSESVSG
ncbi:MAG: response regulator [Gemmatimonadetes bacterium]|nr:response regulator [Gemmatimonadota bacterium]